MASKLRGSVVDAVTLYEIPFQYEPKIKEKSTATYAKQHVIGRRLNTYTFVGGGSTDVEVDIYIVGVNESASYKQQLQAFLESQDDVGTPHPIYLNIGDAYLGKLFVLVDMETKVPTFEAAQTMNPAELALKLKFDEIPVNRRTMIGRT